MSFFEFPHTRTYDGDLGWLIKHVGSYDETINALNEWKAQAQLELDDLMAFMEAMESGTLPEPVKNAIIDWLRINAIDLMGELVKTVFFEIDDNGYFVAYIPDSWDDIIFNTTEYDISIPEEPDFGHLVLSY